MKTSVNLFILSFFAMIALSACGIKPSKLTPPQGKEKDGFPHTYPSPSSLPRPESQ